MGDESPDSSDSDSSGSESEHESPNSSDPDSSGSEPEQLSWNSRAVTDSDTNQADGPERQQITGHIPSDIRASPDGDEDGSDGSSESNDSDG